MNQLNDEKVPKQPLCLRFLTDLIAIRWYS